MKIPAVNDISTGIVFLSWFVFALGILLQGRAQRKSADRYTTVETVEMRRKEGKRSPRARLGLLIAIFGFAFAFFLRRKLPSPFLPLGPLWEDALTGAAALLAAASVGLALSAVHHLGKQFRVAARIIEGHALVTTGPYRIVRHPIYTAMLGLLLATGLAITTPIALVPAIAFYLLGTFMRIQAEEKLLLDHFGKPYEDYRKKVPALIPFVI